MISKIGVGIIGANPERSWASRSHVPALRALPDYELVAVSTTRIDTAREAARMFGAARAFADHRALVADPAVDLVVVAVRVTEHVELVESALDAGKAVFCEWPLGNGLAEAERLTAKAAACGARTAIGLQARAVPAIRYVRDLVAEGYIGELLSTTLIGAGDNWGATVRPGAGFILDRSNGTTMLTVPLAHTLDALCWSLGEFTEIAATTAIRRPVVAVAGTSETLAKTAEDQVAVTGRLSRGAVAAVHYRGGTLRATNLLWEINGSEGDLLITGDAGNIQLATLAVAGGRGADKEIAPLLVPDRYVRAPDAPAGLAFNVAQAYAGLAEDIRNGTHNSPTFSDALVRHRMLAAIEQAAATGSRQLL